MRFSEEQFDPDDVALAGRALDAAISDLTSAGVPFGESAKVRMANCLLAAISTGERDFEWLLQVALEAANGSTLPALRGTSSSSSLPGQAN